MCKEEGMLEVLDVRMWGVGRGEVWSCVMCVRRRVCGGMYREYPVTVIGEHAHLLQLPDTPVVSL